MIRACIFDLGGTIVDKYSLTPFLSFKDAFKKLNINISDKLIYKDMGKDKKEHIQLILEDSNIRKQWFSNNNTLPNIHDINHIYNLFNQHQYKNSKFIDIIPETYDCINYLRNNNINTGCTTGFNKENMNNIKYLLKENNLNLDSYVSSTCVKKQDGTYFTRPCSGMIYQNLKNLNLTSTKNVIKVDDTNIGIEEGKNSGCITVGVARWSTYMKVSPSTLRNINDDILNAKIKESRKILSNSNPDFLITSLNELPSIISFINNKV